MAKIPEYGANLIDTGANPPSAREHYTSMGAADDAVANLGDKVANIGSSLLEARKKAADHDDAYGSFYQDTVDFEKFKEQAQLQAKADGSSYGDTVKQWVNDRMDTRKQNARSGDSAQIYSGMAAQAFTHEVASAYNQENQWKIQDYSEKISKQSDEAQKQFQLSPDVQGGYNNVAAFNAQVDAQKDLYLNDSAKETAKENHKVKVFTGLMNGFSDIAMEHPENSRSVLAEARKLVTGTHKLDDGAGDDKLADAIDADQQQKWIQHLDQVEKHVQSTQYTSTMRQVADDSYALRMGLSADVNSIRQKIMTGAKIGAIQPDEAIRKIDDVNTSVAIGKARNEMLGMDPADWPKRLQQLSQDRSDYTKEQASKYPGMEAALNPNFNIESRTNLMASANAMAKGILKQRQDDIVSVALQATPSLSKMRDAAGDDPDKNKQYRLQLDAQQKAMGVAPEDRKILGGDEIGTYSSLLDSKDPNQLRQTMQLLRTKYGEDSGKAISELVDADTKKGGTKLQGFWVSSYVSNETTQKDILDNSTRTTEITKAFKTEAPHTTESQIDRKLASNMAPFFDSINNADIGGSGAFSKSIALQNQMKLSVMKLMASGDHLGIDDAIEKVKRLYVDSNFSKADGLYVPKTANADLVESTMHEAFRPENLATLKPRIPDGTDGRLMGLKGEDLAKEYLSHVQNNGRWISNAGGDGMRLVVRKGDGTYTPVRNADGKGIEYKYDDITKNPPPFALKNYNRDQAFVDARTGISTPDSAIGKF